MANGGVGLLPLGPLMVDLYRFHQLNGGKRTLLIAIMVINGFNKNSVMASNGP